MKPYLVLVSHGLFAKHARMSAEMIVGKIEGLYTVCMSDSDGLDGITKKLQAVFNEIGDNASAVIVVDMMAGTPCNIALRVMLSRDNVRIVTGLNLPMVIEYSVSDEENPDQLAAFLREVGLEAVQNIERPQLPSGEEGYED